MIVAIMSSRHLLRLNTSGINMIWLHTLNRLSFKYKESMINAIFRGNNFIAMKNLSIAMDLRAKFKSIVADADSNKKKIIDHLNFKCEDDALPFFNLSIKSLLHIYKTTKNDEENRFCTNRLYYLSDRLGMSSSVLSELVAKRLFIYSLTFKWLESSLNVLLDFEVPCERIARDLWVLKYHHKTIYNRLLKVKECGIENVYPWMVRCSEDILNRFITLSQETKFILGDTKSAKYYLATRLNTTPEYIEDIYIKIPALKSVRVPKVKKFLDYLINEGFSEADIANKPRLLITSQDTVQQRIEKLKELGVKDINLNVLCKSKKDFSKYCEAIKSTFK